MIRIYVARHPTDAHLFKGILESEGIDALVRGEALFGARGETPRTFVTLPAVWVRETEQGGRASELAREYSRDVVPEGASTNWRCATCREIVEQQFTACWNCGSLRVT